MADIVTVDFLAEMLKKLQEQGNGDMKIKCKDCFLHEDEIFINHTDGEMKFDGCIFHIDAWGKTQKFREEVDRVWKDFNNSLIREQETGVKP